jgi:hypothetical protein
VLHALSVGGGSGFGVTPNPTIAVNVAMVQAVQGYTNSSDNALLIPLSAFQGLVDYHIAGAPGSVSAGLAITTSAIQDPFVAAQWSASDATPGHFGQFAANCGTAGALAIGNPSPANSGPSPNTQYLGVSTSSCSGSDTYLLDPGETFYVWARLGVVHSSFGVTDALNTFNVTIAPEYQAQVLAELAPVLAAVSGADLDIPMGAVPEPSTWAMMILGFGAAGALLRRRRLVAA